MVMTINLTEFIYVDYLFVSTVSFEENLLRIRSSTGVQIDPSKLLAIHEFEFL